MILLLIPSVLFPRPPAVRAHSYCTGAATAAAAADLSRL